MVLCLQRAAQPLNPFLSTTFPDPKKQMEPFGRNEVLKRVGTQALIGAAALGGLSLVGKLKRLSSIALLGAVVGTIISLAKETLEAKEALLKVETEGLQAFRDEQWEVARAILPALTEEQAARLDRWGHNLLMRLSFLNHIPMDIFDGVLAKTDREALIIQPISSSNDKPDELPLHMYMRRRKWEQAAKILDRLEPQDLLRNKADGTNAFEYFMALSPTRNEHKFFGALLEKTSAHWLMHKETELKNSLSVLNKDWADTLEKKVSEYRLSLEN